MSSIPLVALQVKPPEQQDPVGLATKVANLKGLLAAQPLEQQQRQQAVQAGGLDIQQKQYEIAQRDAVNKAWKDAITNDPSTGAPKLDEGKMMNAIGAAGYGSAGQAIAEHLATYHKTLNDNTKLQQEIEANSRDSGGAIGYALQKASYDPGLANALIDQQLNNPNLDPQHKQMYAQIKQQLAQAPDPDSAKNLVKQVADPMIAQSDKYSKLQQEDITAQAKNKDLALRTKEFEATLPGGSKEDPARAQMQAWLKKNPGKDEADYEVWKSKLNPLAQITVANAAGGGMAADAVDQAAEMYHLTGKLPPGGRGVAGLAQNRKIMNRAAELYPGSMGSDTAEYAANKKSLEHLQTQFDSVSAFEKTARRNLQLLSKKIDAIPDLGTRFANTPLRLIQGNMIGDKAYGEMKAALLTARSEVGRVLASASAAGAVPVSQAQEVQEALDGNMPGKTAKGVIDTFLQDMDNRHVSYDEQIKDIQSKLGGKKAGASTTPAGSLNITLPSGKQIKID